MKYEEVKWLDHASFTEQIWRHSEEYDELIPQEITTVGQLLRETDELIILVLCYNPEQKHCSGDIMIMKNSIISRRELK